VAKLLDHALLTGLSHAFDEAMPAQHRCSNNACNRLELICLSSLGQSLASITKIKTTDLTISIRWRYLDSRRIAQLTKCVSGDCWRSCSVRKSRSGAASENVNDVKR
jgi:hypothetical protein